MISLTMRATITCDCTPLHVRFDVLDTFRYTGKEPGCRNWPRLLWRSVLSSAQGRFTSSDWSATPQPIPYADLTDPQTLNLYGYVRNNPLARADPNGHCCLTAPIAA